MNNFEIKNGHRGEDYYGFTIQGKYVEVSVSEGQTILSLIKTIKLVVNGSNGHNEVIK